MNRGKKYKKSFESLDKNKVYEAKEAIDKIKEVSFVKFDETVELAMNLNLKKGALIRDTITLPNQFRTENKVLVFAKGEKAQEAKDAGATYVGGEDLVQKIKDGWLDFSVAIATPDMMKEIAKVGAILGRRGLMPNPKTQTVTNNIKEAVAEFKKGKVEFRTDKNGNLHLAIGKVSMDSQKIEENFKVVLEEIKRKKPQDTKGQYIKSINISATMTPSLKLVM